MIRRYFNDLQFRIRRKLIRLLAGNLTVIINAESAGIVRTGVGGLVHNVRIDPNAAYDSGISIKMA
jgi:hypothetical protein